MKNESISCDCWRNPPFLFTKVSSPNSDHNALATLQPLGLTLLDIFGMITYFNRLEVYPIQFLYDISSASSISPNTINATLVDFFCVLSGDANYTIDLYFPAYVLSPAFSKATQGGGWPPTFSHRRLHSFQELPFISLIKFRSDLTSNHSDYTSFVWRVLLLFHFIEDNMLQNNQLNSFSQR